MLTVGRGCVARPTNQRRRHHVRRTTTRPLSVRDRQGCLQQVRPDRGEKPCRSGEGVRAGLWPSRPTPRHDAGLWTQEPVLSRLLWGILPGPHANVGQHAPPATKARDYRTRVHRPVKDMPLLWGMIIDRRNAASIRSAISFSDLGAFCEFISISRQSKNGPQEVRARDANS